MAIDCLDISLVNICNSSKEESTEWSIRIYKYQHNLMIVKVLYKLVVLVLNYVLRDLLGSFVKSCLLSRQP